MNNLHIILKSLPNLWEYPLDSQLQTGQLISTMSAVAYLSIVDIG